jgi:adenine-specific DNA-methyltransferase
MIADRASTSKKILGKDGVFGIAIDDTETGYLRSALDSVFGRDNFISTIAIEVNPAGQNLKPDVPARSHDYFHVYAVGDKIRSVNSRPLTKEEKEQYPYEDDEGRYYWDNLRRRGGNSRPSDRPNQWYPLYVNLSDEKVSVEEFDGSKEIWPVDGKGIERVWRVNPETAKREINEGYISVKEISGEPRVVKKTYMPEGKKPKTLWSESKYSATSHGTKLLNNVVPENDFTYPKSVNLVEDCIYYWATENLVVLDPFAGSGTTGHAAINMRRRGESVDKFILIDMAEHYDDVMFPRLKRVVFSEDWNDGVPLGQSGISHVIQYHHLESYEDALNNIEVEKPAAELDLMDAFDDYALRYMLPHEARESETLLAPNAFERPFDYTLRIQHGMQSPKAHAVDLEATFNYLIGLQVQTRRTYRHQDRRYVVVTGAVEQEQSIDAVMVVWRNQEDLDLEAEKAWAAETLPGGPFDTVYVNGPSFIHGQAEPLEIVFRERMDPAAG